MTKKDVIFFGYLVCLAVLVCSCNEQAEESSKPGQNTGPEQSDQAGDIEAKAGRGLREYEKQLLGLIYPGELLEAVRIHVGQPEELPANPIWGLIVQIAVQNGYGVTVGEDMYFPVELDTTKLWGMQWLGHELRHVQQYRQAGGIEQFGAAYVWYLTAGAISLEAGSAYVNNPFENDARVFDGCVAKLLGQRPELLEGLKLAQEQRREWISRQMSKYEGQYRQIIRGCLDKARKRPTTFEISGGKSFTIDFHLKGEFTGPVGGTISFGTSYENREDQSG